MSALLIRCEEKTPERIRLVLKGVLDGTTALTLRDQLLGLTQSTLVLDFSQVQTYVDLAVAVLADALTARDVVMEGLPRHQERMFRYFGVVSAVDAQRIRQVGAETLLAG